MSELLQTITRCIIVATQAAIAISYPENSFFVLDGDPRAMITALELFLDAPSGRSRG
jgi:hypothetical protein